MVLTAECSRVVTGNQAQGTIRGFKADVQDARGIRGVNPVGAVRNELRQLAHRVVLNRVVHMVCVSHKCKLRFQWPCQVVLPIILD